MNSLSPAKKGLLTGTLMILVSIIIYAAKGNFQNNLQYITYAIYVAGIVWALVDFSKTTTQHKFGNYFSQGFKCFIVVTLLMVLFTAAFLILQPQLKEEMARIFKETLIKDGNTTPTEMEERIKTAKKAFLPSLIMAAVFGYLLIGAMVTVVAAVFISNKKKNMNSELLSFNKQGGLE